MITATGHQDGPSRPVAENRHRVGQRAGAAAQSEGGRAFATVLGVPGATGRDAPETTMPETTMPETTMPETTMPETEVNEATLLVAVLSAVPDPAKPLEGGADAGGPDAAGRAEAGLATQITPLPVDDGAMPVSGTAPPGDDAVSRVLTAVPGDPSARAPFVSIPGNAPTDAIARSGRDGLVPDDKTAGAVVLAERPTGASPRMPGAPGTGRATATAGADIVGPDVRPPLSAAAMRAVSDPLGLADTALGALPGQRASGPLTTTLAPTGQPVANGHDVPHQIAVQIAQGAEGGPGGARGTVEISLSPEELGRVRLRLHPSEAGLSVTITADRPETLDLMRRNIDILAREFLDIGYEDAQFDFDQGGQRANGGNAAAPAATTPALIAVAPDTAQPAPVAWLVLGERLDIRL